MIRSQNEIGYLIYLWEQKGYHFYSKPYNEAYDYTPYLSYYTDEKENEKLIKNVLKERSNDEHA